MEFDCGIKVIVLPRLNKELEQWGPLLKRQGIAVVQIESTASLWDHYSADTFHVLFLSAEESVNVDIPGFKNALTDRDRLKSVVLLRDRDENALAAARKAGIDDAAAMPESAEDCLFLVTRLACWSLHEPESHRSVEEGQYDFSEIKGESKHIQEIFGTIKRLSTFATTVLIYGESGTGKELIARAIHKNSPRHAAPFVAINCGAIPENLLESELFGHKKGAFTDASFDKVGLFEEAHGGTVFLDEIGEMPLHLQVKLLRVLQEKSIQRVGEQQTRAVDIRVIAATLRDLETDVKEGRFREDLYFRLNVVSLSLPALRERREDIPLLIDHFLEKHCSRFGIPLKTMSEKALDLLVHYSWRGNIRELENCIERGVVLAEGETIELEHLPPGVYQKKQKKAGSFPGLSLDSDNVSIKFHGRKLEEYLIRRALDATEGNRTHAAKRLEISHRALLYKLKEYGLEDYGK